MLIQILEQVLNGLLAGAYYLLIALGLTLIFSLGGLVNLAHGAFYALGAYFAVKLADTFGFAGALVLSPLAVALIGLVVERLLFRAHRGHDDHQVIVFGHGADWTPSGHQSQAAREEMPEGGC